VERTCFVHIGAPKTGSTFLQKVLASNQAVMREAGLLYPPSTLRGFGHHDIAFLLGGGYPDWATPQPKPLEQLLAETAGDIAGHDGDLLFSSEDFFLFPRPDRLKDFLSACGALRGRRTRIIVYVRRQDEAMEAWYNQAVKAMGETRTIEEACPEYADLWDYGARLSSWADAFGEEAIMVRRFRPAGASPSILEDFQDAVGYSGLRLLESGSGDIVNPRENADVLEFQRAMNRLPLTAQQKRRFHKELMALSQAARGSGIFDERPLLGAEARLRILQRCTESNAEVARRYLGAERLFDLDGNLDDEPTAAAGEGLTAEKLTYILGWILATADPGRTA